jgi:hypothetical protein
MATPGPSSRMNAPMHARTAAATSAAEPHCVEEKAPSASSSGGSAIERHPTTLATRPTRAAQMT